MSKSYNNTIMLSEPEADVRAKLKTMVTDPARVRRTDPGNPDVCPVFDLHKVFSTSEVQSEAAQGCRTAGIGCIQCKGWLADSVVNIIKPANRRSGDWLAVFGSFFAVVDDFSADVAPPPDAAPPLAPAGHGPRVPPCDPKLQSASFSEVSSWAK
jgi:tryptophanyl-tRNA synthetase